jgi:cytochrome c peroxidase
MLALLVAGLAFAQDPNDRALRAMLVGAGMTGTVDASIEKRLGRPIDEELADIGRLLWFDTVMGLHDDNTCGGCHSPTHGFGDTQSVAIGIQNDGIVGPGRTGPRNQRHSPSVVNTAFYPALMWNGRFSAPSGDPFDNSQGFHFPLPEGDTQFPADDPVVTHLLIAQAHIPPTELVEAAGFTGTSGTIGADFDPFDDGLGQNVPAADASGYRNQPIRDAVVERLNAIVAYVDLFAAVFPEVGDGDPIDYLMVARALAEFEFQQTYANAPVDRFVRGDDAAMTPASKRGAALFFGRARCVSCHAVAGESNEMFSDFQNHVIGVPQIVPEFGVGTGNVVFDGDEQDEDFGLEQVTLDPDDRYAFRTAPLRNLALASAFFHDGAYTSLEDAIRHHLDVRNAAIDYDPVAAGVDEDLCHRMGPIDSVLDRLDPLISRPIRLTPREVDDLVAFVRDGLLDPSASPRYLCRLVPESLPSGAEPLSFPGCEIRGR